MSFPGYPYGTVPTHSPHYAQRVAPNASGYVAPVAQTNPFAALVLASGLRQAFSGSSSGTGKTATVVTYDSVYGSGFSKDELKIDADMIKELGLPMALKYEGSDVLIPLPSHIAMKKTIEAQLTQIMASVEGKTQTATALKMFSKQLAMEFYDQDSCGYKLDALKDGCSGLNTGIMSDAELEVSQKLRAAVPTTPTS